MNEFCAQFGVAPPQSVTVGKRHFLDPCRVATRIPDWDIFSLGIYLGEERRGFRPTSAFIDLVARKVDRRVVLSDKAVWLFLCGRDVLMEGVMKTDEYGKNELAIISDFEGNTLGYGRIKAAFEPRKRSVAYVKNLLDKGEYLRRER